MALRSKLQALLEHFPAQLQVPLVPRLSVQSLRLHLFAQALVAAHGHTQRLVRFPDLLPQGLLRGREPVALAFGLRHAGLELQDLSTRCLQHRLMKGNLLHVRLHLLVEQRPVRLRSCVFGVARGHHVLDLRLQRRDFPVAPGNEIFQLRSQSLVAGSPRLGLVLPDLTLCPQLHLEFVLHILETVLLGMHLLGSCRDALDEIPLELFEVHSDALVEALHLAL
mmetsp:Transcript_98127/g.277539  ORF Transcript_98127/g.277539 Transcript_98127/m.277539 type:complete len:223 (+) Transcript_98127:1665-2333(+)